MKAGQRYYKAEVKFNNGNGACVCNQCRVILSFGFDHHDIERYCENCYNKLYRFVYEIANDYFELSHEKIKIQRDDYMRKAKQLLAEIYPDE